jgi:hypothetical protein
LIFQETFFASEIVILRESTILTRRGDNMNKILLQAVGVFFLGSLVGQQALAGAPEPLAEFNSFDFTQAGPIVDLGLDEGSSLNTMLATTFMIDSAGMGGAVFSLNVDLSGPGDFTSNLQIANVVDAGLCNVDNGFSVASTEMHCQLVDGMLNIEPGILIHPGDTFGAAGTISINGTTLDMENDSFVAAPEPAMFALIATGLFGIAFTRRKTAR